MDYLSGVGRELSALWDKEKRGDAQINNCPGQ